MKWYPLNKIQCIQTFARCYVFIIRYVLTFKFTSRFYLLLHAQQLQKQFGNYTFVVLPFVFKLIHHFKSVFYNFSYTTIKKHGCSVYSVQPCKLSVHFCKQSTIVHVQYYVYHVTILPPKLFIIPVLTT